jgi:hypothetical protein
MRLNKSMIGKILTVNNDSKKEFHRLRGKLIRYGGGVAEIAAGPYGEIYKFGMDWKLEKIDSPASEAARTLGSMGGKANTKAQNAARAKNGSKGDPESHRRGGRPKGKK